jgi:ribonuclease HII
MEKQKIDLLKFEKKYISEGYNLIAGMDEAGRGPLAGPESMACVIMRVDNDSIIDGVNDSKKLTPKKREELFDKIIDKAISYKIVFIDEKTIDNINILEATRLGMKKCVEGLDIEPGIVLVDAVTKLDIKPKYVSIIKGDAQSYNIACASILAKVARDRLMVELDKKYPEYDFKTHKGYGTKEHIALLKKYGPCAIHRKTFIKHFIDV